MSDPITTDAPVNQPTTETPPAPNNDKAVVEPVVAADPAGTVDGGNTADAPVTDDTAKAEPGALQTLRETLAGGDAALLKQLERYKSVEAISKMVRESRSAAEKASKPLVLGEKATEQEVKAFRTAMGIPDEAKDYPLKFRDDFKSGEADTALLTSVKEYVHEKNGDPRTAGVMLEWYQDFATAQKQELDGNLAKVAKETQSALRSEWGGEYDGNIGAASELMTTHLGKEGFDSMMGLRLMDGSRLQDNVAFVKMMAQLGGDYYGGNAIHHGDVETTAKTVQESINELLSLRGGSDADTKKFYSDQVQEKLTKLYTQRDRLSAKK